MDTMGCTTSTGGIGGGTGSIGGTGGIGIGGTEGGTTSV